MTTMMTRKTGGMDGDYGEGFERGFSCLLS